MSWRAMKMLSYNDMENSTPYGCWRPGVGTRALADGPSGPSRLEAGKELERRALYSPCLAVQAAWPGWACLLFLAPGFTRSGKDDGPGVGVSRAGQPGGRHGQGAER